MYTTVRAIALALLAPVLAHAAPGDEGLVTEEIEVTAVPTKAPRPSLNLSLPNYDLPMQDLRFPSGLRVIFQRDTTQPIVAITSVTDHGSSSDPLGKEGIAHLVEHLWFRSEHGELPKTWDLLEAEMGCDLNAFTQYDITAYMTSCGSQFLEAMLKLESLRVTNTIHGVTEEMVDTEVEVVRNEIRMRGENFNIPFFTMWEYVNKHMFPEGHPYHRPIAGDHTTIRNCKLADVQKFTEDYYRPQNTTIMVVGDLPDTSFNYLVDLIVRTFDLSLLDPNLTDELIRYSPKPGVSEPDPRNPSHYYMVPMNPAAPDETLPIQVTFPPRAAEFAGVEPPPPVTMQLGEYEAPVEKPVVVVAWTLPAGYQGTDTLMQISGGLLNGFVSSGLRDSGGNWRLPDMKDFFGCGALPSKRSTTLLCVVEVKSNDANAEQVAQTMISQVSGIYDATFDDFQKQILEVQLSRARNEFLVDILTSVDIFASIGAGRATETSQFAHFTGSPKYFENAMKEVKTVQLYQITELLSKWATRDRAGAVFLKPASRDEVAMLSEDTEGSGGHFRGGGESAILKPSIDPATLTPPVLRDMIATPDLSLVEDIRLPNGLRVVIVPHGEAPLVRLTLSAYGGGAMDTEGVDTLASRFFTFDDYDPLRIGGEWRPWRNSGNLTTSTMYSYVGSASDLEWQVEDTTDTMTLRSSSGNLDAALWMLRERVSTLKPYLAGKPNFIKSLRSAEKKEWFDVDATIRRMRNDHINPGHPYYDDIDWADIDMLEKLGASDLAAYANEKWQPANAVLVIVGNVDAQQAKDLAIRTFAGWTSPDASGKRVPTVPGPNPAKERAVYVFDDKGKTQTNVTLVCPLAAAKTDPSPAHQLLGDVARMTLFAKLREEAGVVYSPFAGAFSFPGGSSMMYMTAAIQNDSAVFAMEQYIEYLESAAKGEVKESDLRIKQLATAAGYVLGQQSIDQMADRLLDTIAQDAPWSSFDTYADQLANLQISDLAATVDGCAEHAFIAFKGPKSKITKQLDAGGYTYEVVDVKKQAEAIYEQADPKGYKAYLKAKAKEEKKKKKSGDEDEDEDEDGEEEDGEDKSED